MNQDPQVARIEELEAENRRLRRFLDETGLPAELRHKVRNTLSMLRAIIRRSAETSVSLETYVAHLDGRLDALARVLNALMRSVPEGIGLHSLVADELLVHLAREGEQIAISGPSLRFRPGSAEVFAMAVHELAVNSVEHGALTVPQGRIHVNLEPFAADGAVGLSTATDLHLGGKRPRRYPADTAASRLRLRGPRTQPALRVEGRDRPRLPAAGAALHDQPAASGSDHRRGRRGVAPPARPGLGPSRAPTTSG